MSEPKVTALIAEVEQYYLLHQRWPTDTELAVSLNCTEGEVRSALKNERIPEMCERRGIPDRQQELALDTAAAKNSVTPQQLAVANVMLDFSDRRSTKAKLETLGVSSQQYAGWLRSKNFQGYMRSRAEAMLGDSTHVAHTSLLKNVEGGDMKAISLFYEMTGRWSSKPASEVNVEYLLIKVLETIQKHIADPDVLRAIATDLGQIANPSPIGTPVVPLNEISAVPF